MTAPAGAVEALLNGDMDEASRALVAGGAIAGSSFENNKIRIFQNIVRHRADDVAAALVERGQIELDLYALDDFERSFYQALATETTGEEASLAFLRTFLVRTYNRNDEVRGKTLLGFFLNAGAVPDAIRCLIDEGCDVRYRDNAERNFVHHVVSARMQKDELRLLYLHMLIEEGVEVDAKDIAGDTPLMTAIKSHQPAALMELLLQHGANPNEQDNAGGSVFYAMTAAHQGKEVYDLLKRYALPDFDLVTKDGQHILTSFLQGLHGVPSQEWKALLLELVRDGADLYQSSPYYGTPKSGADWIAEKPVELMQAVLDAGAIDINRQNDRGDTLLHKVCAIGINFDTDTAKDIYRKARLLLEAGADPALTNARDEIPLILAQRDNLNMKTVELLLKAK